MERLCRRGCSSARARGSGGNNIRTRACSTLAHFTCVSSFLVVLRTMRCCRGYEIGNNCAGCGWLK